MSPSHALAIPTHATFSSRWPGMSQDEREALERDYRSETNELDELNLEDVYHRVRELAVHDEMLRY